MGEQNIASRVQRVGEQDIVLFLLTVVPSTRKRTERCSFCLAFIVTTANEKEAISYDLIAGIAPLAQRKGGVDHRCGFLCLRREGLMGSQK